MLQLTITEKLFAFLPLFSALYLLYFFTLLPLHDYSFCPGWLPDSSFRICLYFILPQDTTGCNTHTFFLPSGSVANRTSASAAFTSVLC